MSFSSSAKRSRSERPKDSRSNSSRRRKCPNRNASEGVAERLEALKELIPSMEEKVSTADQIFEEAADYILLLRTRVEILKQMVEFYGTGDQENASVSSS